jgi:hypothetical protein
MKRLLWMLAIASLAAACLPGAAQADFGLHGLDVGFGAEGGGADTQAGSHPFAMTTDLGVDTVEDPVLKVQVPAGDFKDLTVKLPPGLVADRDATPQCAIVDFLPPGEPRCPPSSMVGIAEVEVGNLGAALQSAKIYNLVPPPGAVAKLGFLAVVAPVSLELGLSQSPPYNGVARQAGIPQITPFYSAEVEVWGTPAAKAHDAARGGPAGVAERPFLTLPRSCTGPMPTTFEATSWQGGFFAETILSHGDGPEPLGMTGCGKLGFSPGITAQPTDHSAQSPTGLDFGLNIADEGLANPEGIAQSDLKKAVVTLPKGMSVNPAQAEGLGVCSESELKGEKLESEPGEGCPQSSKIGTVEVESPLVQGEVLKGALYIAKPYENPFNSLLALYMTIKSPKLGVEINLAGKIEPDPVTGQLITTFGGEGTEPLPQLPFSHFRLHFNEGARSPLITPPGCGTFTTKALLTPWANPESPYETGSAFTIDSGPGGGPCPSGGSAPFHPGFSAGSLNAAAGTYSPFYMRITRQDGEQDMTRFSSVLPPGVVGRIAGIPYCPEAAIAQAKSRTGAHGGTEELEHPSCPAASRIGRTSAGAGVGSQLTYVPGSLYLAGPYHGDPLSVVSITPAVAGPFDAGTVVVREALTLNPVTAEVEVDGSASDPIPHILQGIPLNVRELEIYADRPDFTLNPTSCARSQARATLWGAGSALQPTAETPVGLSSPYQAVNCAKLGFAPKLQIKLKGGTKRGAHPALEATVTPRPGDANFGSAVVTLPHSAFLDQGHIRTICTRVQFAAGAGNGAGCPAGSVYGQAKAWSPLLDEPLQGPVYLRSSSHNLPDLVVALHGLVNVELASRIDSVKGGIRSSFESIPDAPVSKFVLQMQGAKKGLIVNSTDLCAGANRAKANLTGQNGKRFGAKPVVGAGCGKSGDRRHSRATQRRDR